MLKEWFVKWDVLSIRLKAMKRLLSDVQIDFKEDEPIQEVKIAYNDQNVNESKIQSTIESIKRQFSISAIRTKDLIE